MALLEPELEPTPTASLNLSRRPRGRGMRHPLVARLLADRVFLIGFIIVMISLGMALFGPFVVPHDPLKPDPNAISSPPSSEHWFGTDITGLDVFSRVIVSARIDVLIALAATIVSLVVGSLIGVLVSYYRSWLGRIGDIALRGIDVVQAFPLFVLAMVLVVTAGRSLVALLFILAFLNVPVYIRLTRSQVLALRSHGFVEAARATGLSESAIAFKHVYPNALAPSLVQASITMGWAIILTAGLSFIGAGIRPPTPEWGAMISIGSNQLVHGEWWSSAFPGITMAIVVFGFAATGEGLASMLRGEK